MENLLYHKIEGDTGPCLVVIHGLFGSSDNWQTLTRRWSQSTGVLSIDVRNHGKSFHSEDMSFEAMAKDVITLLDFYNIEKSFVLGHSMGGKIAMSVAELFPERVQGLLIADMAPYKYSPHHKEVFELLDQIDLSNFGSRKEIEEEVLRKMPNDIATAQFILKNIKRNESTMHFEYKFNLPVLRNCYLSIIQYIPSSGFDGNVVFLQGENSWYISPDTSHLIFELYPNAQIEVVPNAGHWIHADNPESVYQIVEDYIAHNAL